VVKKGHAAPVRRDADDARPSRRQKTPLLGTVLASKYKLLENIGEGGFGVVYLAKAVASGERVAIKHLRKQKIQNLVERFEREEAVMRLIADDGIVRVIERFHLDGYGHFLVMEHVDGRALDDLIADQDEVNARLDFRQILDIMESLLLTARVLDAHGVVHRDIKPENIMVSTDADGRTRTKIMDFGVAKVMGGNDGPGMHAGMTSRCVETGGFALIGTPEFMSPEQIQSATQDAITVTTDIYALGALLYCMLVNEPPFVADPFAGNAVLDILRKQIHDDPPDARDVRPEVPERLACAVQKAMAKKQADRYLSADEFLSDIKDARKELGLAEEAPSKQEPVSIEDLIGSSLKNVSAIRFVTADELMAPTESEPSPVMTDPSPSRTGRRHVRIMQIFLGTALLIILGVLWLLLHGT